MIDCLKVHNLPVTPEKLLNNGLLTFPLSNVATTGEVLNRWQVAYFNTLAFKTKGNNSRLTGSLHKHKQGGKNWQDFNFFDIQETIQELAETFEFDPEKAVINFIEIGINIPMDYDPTRLIKCFVIHGNKSFEILKVEGKGYGKISEKDQFTIKVYNKSLQNSLPFHLLRFEIKVKRMKFLERYGINDLTLSDLTRPEIYPKFKTMLLDLLSGIVIYNPDIDPDKLTNLNDRELLKYGKFADYWTTFDRRRKNEKLIRFKGLAGTNEIIENLKCKISDKWERLTIPDKITTFENEIEPDKITTLRNKQYKPENDKTGQNHTTIKGDIVRTCIVTKLPIHNQRTETNLTSKGVRWYFENEPETYKNKLEIFLTSKWLTRHFNESMEVYFSEIYHQIRNKKLNPKNNTFRDYQNLENKGLKLFPTIDLLPPEKLRLIKINIQNIITFA